MSYLAQVTTDSMSGPEISSNMLTKHGHELAIHMFKNCIKHKKDRKSLNLVTCHDIICTGCDKKLRMFGQSCETLYVET
jgi:hypothetical protein